MRIIFQSSSLRFSLLLLALWSTHPAIAIPTVVKDSNLADQILRMIPIHFSRDRSFGTQIFSREDKAQFLVRVDKGLMVTHSGEPLSGIYIYFLDNEDHLYVVGANFALEHAICHSSFDEITDEKTLAGICKMAGEIRVIRTLFGQAVYINHLSGHYQPNFNRVHLAQDALVNQGFLGTIELTQESLED